MVLKILICLVLGYLFGNFSTAFIVAKARHIDIRTKGSGNLGATNVLRNLGKTAGALTLVGDFIKTYIPLMLVRYVIYPDLPETEFLVLICAFGCAMGHNFPFWLGFKGGKGVAVLGTAYVATSHWAWLIGVAIFVAVTYATKYVSVGSLTMAVLFPFWVAYFNQGNEYYAWMIAVSCLFTISTFYMHRANLVRLKNGNENKIGQKKTTSEA